jgi:hypothetical protein
MSDPIFDLEGTGMSDVRQARAADPGHAGRRREPTGWVGWIVFSGLLMIMIGVFQAIMGFVALFKEDYYLVGREGLVVELDYTAWGWTHLILGTLVLVAGLGILAGQMWARVIGIILAMLSAIVNLAFLAAYPVWGIIVITMDVLIIYALCVHGREVKTTFD